MSERLLEIVQITGGGGKVDATWFPGEPSIAMWLCDYYPATDEASERSLLATRARILLQAFVKCGVIEPAKLRLVEPTIEVLPPEAVDETLQEEPACHTVKITKPFLPYMDMDALLRQQVCIRGLRIPTKEEAERQQIVDHLSRGIGAVYNSYASAMTRT